MGLDGGIDAPAEQPASVEGGCTRTRGPVSLFVRRTKGRTGTFSLYPLDSGFLLKPSTTSNTAFCTYRFYSAMVLKGQC